jgi:hypothetical protein
MVELHRSGMEEATAIGARSLLQLPEPSLHLPFPVELLEDSQLAGLLVVRAVVDLPARFAPRLMTATASEVEFLERLLDAAPQAPLHRCQNR